MPVRTCIIVLLEDIRTRCLPSVASVVLTPALKNVFFFLRNFGYFFSEQDSNVTASYRTMGSISYRTAQKKAFVAQLTFVPNVLFHGLIKQLYSICFAL